MILRDDQGCEVDVVGPDVFVVFVVFVVLDGAPEVVVVPAGRLASAIAERAASMVGTSTVPVAGIPSEVWKDFKAFVSASVHCPSIGPAQ